MQIKETLDKLENCSEFKTWRAEDNESYLAHLFVMKDENNEKNLQIGYYNPSQDKMIVFVERNDNFEKSSEMDIFKKDDAKITKLDLEKVDVEFKDANQTALDFKEEKYSAELIQREIQILQMINEQAMYNNTYITKSFKILNIKIDAEKNEITEHSIESLMNLGKFERGQGGAAN